MPCKVYDQPVSFLVDSGGSCSLIDYPVYQSLCVEVSLGLEPVSDRYVMADGSDLTVHGVTEVMLQIGNQEFPLTMVVAELGHRSAILGLDSLEQYNVTLKLFKGQLHIGDNNLLLHGESSSQAVVTLAWEKPSPWLRGLVVWLEWM